MLSAKIKRADHFAEAMKRGHEDHEEKEVHEGREEMS
jgi:hypothetical protein